MKRWTEAEDEELRDGVVPEGRTESGCAGRAARKNQGREWALAVALRNHIAVGGRVVREDVGGSIGTHWGDATRSGLTFVARHCERLRADGVIQSSDERPNVYFHKGYWK